MDYMKFVEYHREQEADITVGCLPVDYARASDFGLMNIDGNGVITVSALDHSLACPEPLPCELPSTPQCAVQLVHAFLVQVYCQSASRCSVSIRSVATGAISQVQLHRCMHS